MQSTTVDDIIEEQKKASRCYGWGYAPRNKACMTCDVPDDCRRLTARNRDVSDDHEEQA